MKPLFALSSLIASASLITSCATTKNGEYSEYASSDDPYGGAYQPYGAAGGEIPQYQQYSPPQESYTPEPAFTSPAPTYTAPKPASTSKPTTKPKPATKPSSRTHSSSRPQTKSSKSYVVKRGDTLYGVSRKQGASVAAIKKANRLTSDLIRVGQVLVIP